MALVTTIPHASFELFLTFMFIPINKPFPDVSVETVSISIKFMFVNTQATPSSFIHRAFAQLFPTVKLAPTAATQLVPVSIVSIVCATV